MPGILEAYLDTPCTRRRSKAYQNGVKTGKTIGYVSAAALFVVGSGAVAVAGALPVVSRGVKYLGRKLKESHDSVKTGTTTPGTPT